MIDDIKLPSSPNVKKTKFKGSPKFNLKVLKYLKNKYKEYCVIIPKISKKHFEHEDISLRWIETNNNSGYFSVPKNYWELFKKCENKRFIIFPFGFSCLNNIGHANYMIYDRNEKALERFEPYGKTKRKCTNPLNIDDKIKKLFIENLGSDFIRKYYKPLDFLGEKSFQKYQEDEGENNKEDPQLGFCSAWVAWYTELRLTNPNKDRKRIVKLSLQKLKNSDKTMTEYIRGYSSKL
jgi:hypothetical protein